MINQQWIEELLRTDKQQGYEDYCYINADGDRCFCAIGVGLALYFEQECELPLNESLFYNDDLVVDGLQWLGIAEPAFVAVAVVTEMNDRRRLSFREIAERLKHMEIVDD